jgi:hypothetical protein
MSFCLLFSFFPSASVTLSLARHEGSFSFLSFGTSASYLVLCFFPGSLSLSLSALPSLPLVLALFPSSFLTLFAVELIKSLIEILADGASSIDPTWSFSQNLRKEEYGQRNAINRSVA